MHISEKLLKNFRLFNKKYHLRDFNLRILRGKEFLDYIERHCRVYYDTDEDDPILLPNGRHPSMSVRDLKTFNKYFKIVPKTDLGFVTYDTHVKSERKHKQCN